MNMKRWSLLLLFVAACSLSAAAGFWLGFREAWWLAPAAYSLPRGTTAAILLKSLAAGKPSPVVTTLESDVDNGLIWGYELFHYPLREFLSPIWGIEGYPENYEKYAVRLANYRMEHPSPIMKPDALAIFSRGETEQDKAFYETLSEGKRRAEFKLNAMVKRYASKH